MKYIIYKEIADCYFEYGLSIKAEKYLFLIIEIQKRHYKSD